MLSDSPLPPRPAKQFWVDAWATLTLAVPLMAGQVSQMLMGVADTVMIGHVGVVPLAASAFALNLLHVPFVFGIGLLTAISVRVSQARGAGAPEIARSTLRHGLWVALFLGIATMLLACAVLPWLGKFRQDPEVVAAAPGYLLLVAASLTPALLGMALKNHTDAMNRPWPAFWITLAGVGLNILLNAIFIHGKFGVPAMGLEGAGVATLLARLAVFVALAIWCRRAAGLEEWVAQRWLRWPVWAELRSLVALGFPSALQLLAEVSAFVMAGLMIGSLGKEALGAHQVALTCAATIFMIPLGMSMALTVRVGVAVGAGHRDRLRTILLGAMAMAGVYTVLSFLVILGGRYTIAGWFITDPATLGVAAGLLLVSAAFQASDAVQILAVGALRGLEDVRFPAVCAFAAFWLIGLPAGWWLAFQWQWGVAGVWWGITLGLTLNAVLFSRRFWWLTAHRMPHVKR